MSQGTILIVDDESHIRHVVGQRLRTAGYNVVEAADGKEALDLAIEQRPDLVISDLQMPVMSGLELCTKLHENPATASIPAILLTARGYLVQDEAGKLPNIRFLLAKPFSVRDVLERVQSIRAAA